MVGETLEHGCPQAERPSKSVLYNWLQLLVISY